MKVVIIGGSAHSTPALFGPSSRWTDAFEFVLVGRSQERLNAVARAARVLSGRRGGHALGVASLEHLDEVLRGASAVVIQVRVGGYAARAWDEIFPHRYGMCGDEGLGPGGLAAAWRTWPIMRSILASIQSACPESRVIVMTAPLGILLNAAIEQFPTLRIVGICELPWVTLSQTCAGVGQDARTANYSYAGINHLGWFCGIDVDTHRIVDEHDTLALPYVGMHTNPRETFEKQRGRAPRGEVLQHLAVEAFDVYTRGTPEEITATLRRRPTPWYTEAVAPMLLGIHEGTADIPLFLSSRNGAACPWLEPGAVVEHPYRISNGDLYPIRLRPLRNVAVRRELTRMVRYEAAAARAIQTRRRADLSATLALHPWQERSPVQDDLVDDVMATDVPTVSR